MSAKHMKSLMTSLRGVSMIMLLVFGLTLYPGGGAAVAADDVQQSAQPIPLTPQEPQSELDFGAARDSVRLARALHDGLDCAQRAFTKDSFATSFQLHPDDSSYPIKLEILIGRLFDGTQKYFLLRRHAPWATYLDLYRITATTAQSVLAQELLGQTYLRDTIVDVNGDGMKDFLVHWYPSSGCCKRDIYKVYLKQAAPGNFSREYQFINPSFSAQEKLIRGVEYGLPGEAGLYTFAWNGLDVDTVEYLYPHPLVKGQFIKTHKSAYRPTEQDGVVVQAVPKPYHAIESYQWFADY